ncbi:MULTISPECIES: acyl carrier protein [Mumia]|uniref:acyl carrier protein n=1 Tax=Mumia TaxID=1546255 RepID=UPI0014240092|nr:MULTISPECIES: hypothetical protein [unclassified Mumia]QMW67642.1 hypothetical protein H4N58_07120 [Mumia sp. ZJ1417]
MHTPASSVVEELTAIVDQIAPGRAPGVLSLSSSFVDDLRMGPLSLGALSLGIEERFDVRVPVAALSGTVGDVVAHVERELASG